MTDVSASPATQIVCPGASITTIFISNPNGIPGTTFSWNRDNVEVLTGMPASGSGSSINGILFSSLPNTLQTTTFSITANANGCLSTTTVQVVVGDIQPPVINCRTNLIRNTNPGTCTYTVAGTEFNPLSFSDNCSGSSITNTYNGSNTLAGAVFPKGSTIVTWRATDASGNSVQCNSTILVNDIQQPLITCRPGSPFIRYTHSNSCNYTVQGNELDPTSFSDNCPGVVVRNDYNNSNTLSGVQIPRGFHTIRWIATDASDNFSECTITVNVIDNVPPVITYCPPRLNVPCPNNIPIPDSTLVTASDNCGNVIVRHFKDEYFGLGLVPGYCPDSIIRIYRAIDGSGNHTDCKQVIRPLSPCGCQTCQSNVPHFWVNMSGRCDSVWRSPNISRRALCCGATSPQRCISFSVMLDQSAVGFYMLVDGAAPPGWYYQVNCGQEVPLGAVICLEPGIYHTITICKPGANANQYTIGSVCGIIGISDLHTRINCSSQITISGVVPSSVVWTDITGGGQYLRYLSPTTGSLVTNFRADSLAPSVIRYRVCGNAAQNPCSSNGILCAVVTVYVYPNIRINISPPHPVFCENDTKDIVAQVLPLTGNYQINWRNAMGQTLHQGGVFRPPGAGNYSVYAIDLSSTLPCSSATETFSVAFTNCLECPAGQYYCSQDDVVSISTVSALIQAGGVVSFPCEVSNSNIALVDVIASQGTCPQMFVYRYLVWDICGNRDTCDLLIEINDTIAPSFTRPADITIFKSNDCSYNANPSVTGDVTDESDDCSTGLQAIYNDFVSNGPCPGSKVINRTWTLSDGCGNAAAPQIQTITVLDNTPPALSCPGNIIVQGLPLEPYNFITIDPPMYFDNCTPVGQITISWTMAGSTIGSGSGLIPSNYLFNIGTTTVTYTATDACGNFRACSFSVRVNPVPPVISCPPNLNLQTDAGVCTTTINPGLPVLTSGTPIVVWIWMMTGATQAQGNGFISPISYTFNHGITTIRYVATNMAGADTCYFTVQVTDNEPPTFTAPSQLSFCVNNIITAVYDGMPEPMADFNPDRPEWYLFRSGDTHFDLDPNTFSDNCSLNCNPVIRWRINFADGSTIPANPALFLPGQPSMYGTDIRFPGDGINFGNLIHTITYWIIDCHGNISLPVTTNIIISPRPNIIKIY
ncbi:MAG: HYR domain-containing protein [Bacteroidales bacterium]|nr:HYR domain-containing protein [Bacteroidales bacterium]